VRDKRRLWRHLFSAVVSATSILALCSNRRARYSSGSSELST
jgi:hypothetical protein